jgi:hypothetical protein
MRAILGFLSMQYRFFVRFKVCRSTGYRLLLVSHNVRGPPSSQCCSDPDHQPVSVHVRRLRVLLFAWTAMALIVLALRCQVSPDLAPEMTWTATNTAIARACSCAHALPVTPNQAESSVGTNQ